jgi:hypothetical protein
MQYVLLWQRQSGEKREDFFLQKGKVELVWEDPSLTKMGVGGRERLLS